MHVKDFKTRGGGLKWAKVQAYEWDDMLHAILKSNLCDSGRCDWIGLRPTLDSTFTTIDDDYAEMCDHVTGHIKSTLAAIAEYREMGKMYSTWPWVSCLLVDEPDTARQDCLNCTSSYILSSPTMLQHPHDAFHNDHRRPPPTYCLGLLCMGWLCA